MSRELVCLNDYDWSHSIQYKNVKIYNTVKRLQDVHVVHNRNVFNIPAVE